MKTDNIFDFMQFDIQNIQESSIYEPTGMDFDKMRRITIDKVRTEYKPKKKTKKRFFAAIAAAALSVAVIGSTAAAMGAFDDLFNREIKTQDTDGSFTSVNISGVSDDVNVICNAITGDEHYVYATLTITKKDGTNFVDNTDDMVLMNYLYDHDGKQINCTTNGVDNSGSGSGNIYYSLTDTKTITAFVNYRQLSCSTIGQTLTVSDSSVFLNHKEKALFSDHSVDGETLTKKIQEINEIYTPQLKENQALVWDEHTEYSLVTRSLIPLNYKISIPTIQQNNTVQLDTSKSEIRMIKEADFRLSEAAASPYNLRLFINSSYNRALRYLSQEGAMDSTTVELENGDIVRCLSVACGKDENTGRYFIFYEFNEEHLGHGKICTIDPKKIKAIYFGETKIFGVNDNNNDDDLISE